MRAFDPPASSKCWDVRHVPPGLVYAVWGWEEPRALCLVGKHSTELQLKPYL